MWVVALPAFARASCKFHPAAHKITELSALLSASDI
jgi:hypothetical protein